MLGHALALFKFLMENTLLGVPFLCCGYLLIFPGRMEPHCFWLLASISGNALFFAVNSKVDLLWWTRGPMALSAFVIDFIVLLATRWHTNHDDASPVRNLYYVSMFTTLATFAYFVFWSIQDLVPRMRSDERARVAELYGRMYLLRAAEVERVQRASDGLFPEAFFDAVVAQARRGGDFERLSPLDQHKAVRKAVLEAVADIETGKLAVA